MTARILTIAWFAAMLALALLLDWPPRDSARLSLDRTVGTPTTRQVGAADGKWYDYEGGYLSRGMADARSAVAEDHWCGDGTPPAITRLHDQPAHEGAAGPVVDLEDRHALFYDHEARSPSTLIAYHGGANAASAGAGAAEQDRRVPFACGL
jgi:hypothetical protein